MKIKGFWWFMVQNLMTKPNWISCLCCCWVENKWFTKGYFEHFQICLMILQIGEMLGDNRKRNNHRSSFLDAQGRLVQNTCFLPTAKRRFSQACVILFTAGLVAALSARSSLLATRSLCDQYAFYWNAFLLRHGLETKQDKSLRRLVHCISPT